jgi:hypothetical protein
MAIRHISLLICPLIAIPTAISSPAFAQAQSSDHAAVDEAAAFFLLDATHARAILRDRGSHSLADRLWAASGQYSAAISEADPDERKIFLPVLQGLRAKLRETVIEPREVDLTAVDAMLHSLEDQVRIQTTPGADPARNGVRVRVGATRAGQPATNYYVWFDLTGLARRNASTNVVSLASLPAITYLVPGDYLVRLRDAQQRPVTQINKTIGNLGTEEPVDILVP